MSLKTLTRLLVVPLLVAFTCISSLVRAASSKEGVQITQLDDRLRIEINGEFFTEYHFKNASRPFLYPVFGPDGLPMTRDWPMKESDNEEHDHKHHRSLWFDHGEMNGIDFWSEEPRAGKTVHEEFTEIKAGREVGIIRSKNKYVAPGGKTICTDDRALRIYNRRDERLFDFEVVIHASNGGLPFGDTQVGMTALPLLHPSRRLERMESRAALRGIRETLDPEYERQSHENDQSQNLSQDDSAGRSRRGPARLLLGQREGRQQRHSGCRRRIRRSRS